MTKVGKISLFVMLFSLLHNQAFATMKIDVSRAAGETIKTVEETARNAVDYYQRTVENLKTYQKMAEGPLEGLKKLKDIKEGIETDIQKVKDAKKSVDDVIDSAKKLQATAQDAVGQIDSAASSLQNQATAMLSNELVKLENQKAEYNINKQQALEDIDALRDAELIKYQDNNKELEAMIAANPENKEKLQKQIDKNNEKIQSITEKYQKQKDKVEQKYSRMGQQLEAQLNKIKQQAMNVDPFSLAKSGGEGLATLFGGEPSVPLNETIVNNFYAADENPTAIREQELNDYRRRTLIEDASSSYAEAVEILRQGDKNLEYVKSLQSNAKILETTPGAVTLDLSVKVENMKNLMKFIRLSVADLKIATAKDMLTISKHLNNYDKDVTQFNLDDYEYKREQVEDLESVPENEIDYTAENGADEDETADTLNDTSVKVEGYAPIMNTFLGKVANLFRSVKLIIYVLAGFGLVGIAFQAIKGRLRWGWLAGLTVGLFVLAAAGALVEYATGSEVSEYFGDTATGAGR